MDKYIYILIYCSILFFGIANYKKYNHNLQLKLWLYFLVYSFLTELIATYFIHILKVRANALYNTWFLMNSIFYITFFYSQLKSKTKRNFIIGYLVIFIVLTIGNIYFLKSYITDILRVNFIIGQFFVVVSIMLYYAELLNSDKILRLHKSLYFWISIGTLVFNIGLLPVFVIVELIQWQGIFNYIILILNLMMATSFITGFIVSKKELNT